MNSLNFSIRLRIEWRTIFSSLFHSYLLTLQIHFCIILHYQNLYIQVLDICITINVFIDSLADLPLTSLTSNHPVEGSIIVNANNYFFPIGVFTVDGPIRLTSTLFQAMGVSASFSGRSPCVFLTFLPIGIHDNSLLQLPHPF
jgi:hypothetical protein